MDPSSSWVLKSYKSCDCRIRLGIVDELLSTHDIAALVRLIGIALHSLNLATLASDDTLAGPLHVETVPPLVVVESCCFLLGPTSLEASASGTIECGL